MNMGTKPEILTSYCRNGGGMKDKRLDSKRSNFASQDQGRAVRERL